MDCAAATVCGKELGESGMEIIRNKGGNDVLLAIGNDKEVAGACGCEVILPAGAGENTRLGTIGTRSLSLCVSICGFGF